MPIKACKTKLEKKYFSKSFGVINFLSDKAKKWIFSVLQTFGHFFVRKFVAPKLLGINVGIISNFSPIGISNLFRREFTDDYIRLEIQAILWREIAMSCLGSSSMGNFFLAF